MALSFLPLPSLAATPSAEALWHAQTENAAHIRQARQVLDRDWTAARYHMIDQAIAENRRLQETVVQVPGLIELHRALQLDLLLALQARGAAGEAIALAAALEEFGPALPPYAEQALGDALMQARQPEKAAERYRRILATQPDDQLAHSGLIYALLESENFAALDLALEAMRNEQPATAATQRRLSQLARFSDRPAQATAHLSLSQQLAPDDIENFLEAGALAAARGLPRKARAQFQRAIDISPDSIHARIGLAEADWATGDLSAASTRIAALVAEMPEHPGVRRLLAAWELGRRPQLVIDVTSGRGEGEINGNDDLVRDTWLFSPRLGASVRVFAHHFLNYADFPRSVDLRAERAHHERAAIGVELTRPGWQAAVEVGQTLDNARDTTYAMRLGWQLGDHWSIRALYENLTDDFPLKGRLEPSTTPGERRGEDGSPRHLHADRSVLGIAYRWHESRRLAADLSSYDFNDGNTRTALNTAWFERLLSRPGKTLDLQTSFYTSQNTKPGPIYFNPSRDYAISATLTGDWLTWRHYERKFNQRLSGTVGNYLQFADGANGEQNFGWKPWYDIRYEHEWQAGHAFVTRYGIGTRRFAYDGDYERKSYVFLNLNWRF